MCLVAWRLAHGRIQILNLSVSVQFVAGHNQTLPLLHRMEERAGERRGRPSPRSSPPSCVVEVEKKKRATKIVAAGDDFERYSAARQSRNQNGPRLWSETQ